MKLVKNITVLRILILLGIFFSVKFTVWFYSAERVEYLPLYILVAISITYKLLRLYFEWYHFFALKETETKVDIGKQWTVDVLTTAVPGEPIKMIEESLTAMANMRYPHTTYLCDEGDDPRLRALCERLGVIHVTRAIKVNAKAGNINNALRSATGEITVILDPDHVPDPGFLHDVLPYFDDPMIGYVQAVQMYSNAEQSWISEGAAQQTYMFYGPLMQAMSHYGTAQAIGANCAFRRSALDSIGGHAPGLTEDMHTSMLLHAKGWKSVYVPHANTRGLVPDNTNGYFKQQLKWSRGAFELYFHVLPKIFMQLSWRQKLHYALLPLHFAIGVIVLLDLSIPIFSLFSGIPPVILEPSEAIIAIVPFLFTTIAIKLYSQRWLIGDNEAGLQLKGGILMFSTWWTFLKGFIFSIVDIKVPYLPTPKRDGFANSFKGLLPNMFFILLGIAAIIYSAYNDWNPYAWMMSGFVVVNTVMLLFVMVFSQQLLLAKLERGSREDLMLKGSVDFIGWFKENIHKPVYRFFLRYSTISAILAIGLFGAGIYQEKRSNELLVRHPEKLSPFYFGLYMPEINEGNIQPLASLAKEMGGGKKIFSYYQSWGPDSAGQFPSGLVKEVSGNGQIVMITWEPWVGGFPETSDAPWLRNEKKGLRAIAEGKFDDYIRSFAIKARDAGVPIMMRFAHEADNPMYPWSTTGGNTAEDFKEAWRKVMGVFSGVGAINVSWVWTPWNPSNARAYYPGSQFVDWVGLTILNYGYATPDRKWRTMEEIYEPYRRATSWMHKPVMFAEFGSTGYGGDKGKWISDALKSVASKYREVKAIVFFNSGQDKNWITDWRPTADTKTIDWRIDGKVLGQLKRSPLSADEDYGVSPIHCVESDPVKPRRTYQLHVAGKPFYIKGVAYNPGHGWESGFNVLNRKSVRKDFSDISELGANTIRRYHPSRYDDLILETAAEKGLKLIYGFWFDPEVDYLKDTVKVQEYYELVEKIVRKYRNDKSIIIWNLGNETGGLLKDHFHQPYLVEVRIAYLRMVDSMARRIHEIDKGSLVTSSLEHTRYLGGELNYLRQIAPSLDVVGINSYYTEQIGALDSICARFLGDKAYIVTEFGPEGYWDVLYNRFDHEGFLRDEDDLADADHMGRNWKNYVEEKKGANLGGVAFCWRERFEGSANWFGITDQKGMKKASYYALKKVWGDSSANIHWKSIRLIGPYSMVKHDQRYIYRVQNANQQFNRYEWKVFSEGTFQKVGSVRVHGKGELAEISVPALPGKYRVYVYAYDKAGNVITVSKPISVIRGVFNEGI
jgi:hypothetical protein